LNINSNLGSINTAEVPYTPPKRPDALRMPHLRRVIIPSSENASVQWRPEGDEIHNKRPQHLCADPEQAIARAEPPEIPQDH
jgi:hypothetical protein